VPVRVVSGQCKSRPVTGGWRASVLLATASLLTVQATSASSQADPVDPYVPSASDFGGVGLLQTRTARFGPDGQMDVGYSSIDPYRRYLVTMQALPWLEGTFRYTSVDNRNFGGGGVLNTAVTYKDRGADLKFKLVPEGRYRPQIAVGLQDGLGTGLFGGEYVVLSKRYHDLDFSLGMGWGYSGQRGGIRNPLLSISDRFLTRGPGTATGGTIGFDQWFTGEEVSLFGGVEYATPIRGVSLKLEFDGNNYQADPLGNSFESDSPINFGVNYRPFSWIDLSAGWERGNLLMMRASLRANVNSAGIPKFDPPPVALGPRPPAIGPGATVPNTTATDAAARSDSGADAVLDAAGTHGYQVVNIEFAGRNAWVTVDQPLRDRDQNAIGQALLSALPPDIDRLNLRDSTGGRHFVTVRSPHVTGIPPALSSSLLSIGLQVGEILREGPDIVVRVGNEPSAKALEQGEQAIALAYGVDTSKIVWRLADEGAPVPFPAINGVAMQTQDTPARQAKIDASSQSIITALEAERIVVDAVLLEAPEVVVYVTPTQFRATAQNMGRVARIVAANAPGNFEQISIVLIAQGMEISRTSIYRRDLEQAVAANGSPEEIFSRSTVEEAPIGIPPNAYRNEGRYPKLSWSASPQLRQNIGGGDTFYAYQLWLALGGQVQLAKGLNLIGTVGANIYNTFDDLKVESPSMLPKVRSDIKNYLQQGENNIVRLQANQLMKLAPALYGRVSAGLFEEMYGGVGAEILFRPLESRFAIGLDINWVQQRDFDQLFTFRDYSVTTGHLNLYYQLPYQNLLAQLHIGRYLAKDQGATFQLSREFESGVRAGVFATLTDVPFALFGEGSFDKGFFVAIPLDLLQVTSSRRQGVFAFRPLTKDGGQRLGVGPRLFDVTSDGTVDSIADSWSSLLQ